jgi:hypothetical protein
MKCENPIEKDSDKAFLIISKCDPKCPYIGQSNEGLQCCKIGARIWNNTGMEKRFLESSKNVKQIFFI